MSNDFQCQFWETFIRTGIPPEGVREEIAQSWLRSRAHGVDPENPTPAVLSKQALTERLQENQELLKFSSAVMRNTYSLAGDTKSLVSLHDRDGYLLDYIFDPPTNDRRERTKYSLGAKWDEASVGTNGVGLTLVLNKPVQIIGAEHFCRSQHYATCSAATIHNEQGDVIGVLNMSGDLECSSAHTLALIASGAYAIENQLALFHSNDVINNTLSMISEGLIILDGALNILMMSRYAALLLGENVENLRGKNIVSIFCPSDFKDKIYIEKKPFSYLESDFQMGDRLLPFRVSVTPMLSENRVTGVILFLQELQAINRVANQVAGNKARYDFCDIITEDPRMLDIIESMKGVAVTDCSVLIEGESGTGKELFAHSIHNYSDRKRGPFIAINCASLPRSLVESELFGYEKGAFTGASNQGNPGKFELANGGTIFLDEIGELPLEIQAKLLRVLDTHRISRIGGKAEKELNVRVIAATNRNLLDEVQKSNFRGDLYYRINVLKFNIPPLRLRTGDVTLLSANILKTLNLKGREVSGAPTAKQFDDAFVHRLTGYAWPGNVRELQNVIVRAYYASGSSSLIMAADLPDAILTPPQTSQDSLVKPPICTLREPISSPHSMVESERELILFAIREHDGDVVEAGKSLKMSKATIYRKIKKHGINLQLTRVQK